MVFKIQKDSDVGTGNPIVARMSIGIFEIIDFSNLEKEQKERLKGNCYELMKLLILAEKIAKPIIEEIAQTLKELERTGIKTQSFGRCIEIPSALSIANAPSFIKYSKQILHKTAENINIIYGKKYKGPHFDKIREDFISEYGKDFIVSKMLTEDQSWIKHIIDLRNEDEHPKTGKPYINDFDIQQDGNGTYRVFRPTFYEGTQIASSLECYIHNLLTFSEEITVYSLAEKFFPPIATIYEIQESERDLSVPKRFRPCLKEGGHVVPISEI